MKKLLLFTLALFLGVSFQALGKKPEILWRKLLKENANCVTWVSVTVKLEISAGEEAFLPKSKNWKHSEPLLQRTVLPCSP
jgi:hypothetical protein